MAYLLTLTARIHDDYPVDDPDLPEIRGILGCAFKSSEGLKAVKIAWIGS